MEAIVADGLRKAYGGTAALRGVSLSVDGGEVFALVGPNGAGKTTLVRCLTGTTRPDDGRAALLESAPETVGEARVGLLPQEFDPPGRLTARELVAYYAGLYDEARDADAVIEDVGVADAADTWYANLSGGQKRRTLVGTALVNDPEVLFLDEPTTGIDPAGRRAVWSLVGDLAAGGTTVFLTTHYMEEAERLADRVGVIADGELVATGRPADLVAEYGGASRLVVETDADVDAGIDLPYPVERTDRGFLVEGVDPRDIGDVVDALEAAGVGYGALAWREPGLETVYLSLTGETPRAAEHDPAAVGEER